MKLLIEVTQVPISENPDLTEISKALIKIQEDVVNKYQKYDQLTAQYQKTQDDFDKSIRATIDDSSNKLRDTVDRYEAELKVADQVIAKKYMDRIVDLEKQVAESDTLHQEEIQTLTETSAEELASKIAEYET